MTPLLDKPRNESAKVADLVSWEQNPREIDKEHFSKLTKYIKKYGLLTPLIIDGRDGKTVLGGNMRLKALQELGIEEVNVNIVDIKSDTEAVEVALLDNNQFGRYVEGELISLVDNFPELNLNDFEIDLNPISLIDIQRNVDGEIEVEEDDFEPPREAKYQIKQGEVWQLGEHRLMCGDSVKIEDVERLMDGQKADMVFTDPPYNADYSSSVDKTRRKPWGGIMNDSMSYEAFDEFLIDANSTIWSVLKDGGATYECIDWKHYPQLAHIFSDAFTHKSTIIWNKNYFGLGTYYRTKYEMILFGIKGEQVSMWNAAHDEMDVWDEKREKTKNYVHPTQKPVEIPARAIKNTSNDRQVVLDPFGGSGSTLIACEQLNRKCYMMELDPYYCSVTIERWEKLTGKEAVKLG